MNRSVTPSKRINSIHRTPSSNQRGSASKSPIKKDAFADQQLQEKLRKNRQKLTHTLETYTMLIRSNNPIRCLEHNSVISIFCETQGKLLCTNCVFGKNQHKFHRINPVDKSHEKMKQSLQKIKLQIAKQMNTIENIKEIVLINLDQEMIDLEKGLESLTIRYAESHKLLEDSFLQAKSKLINTLQQLRIKHQTVALQLNFLKDIYDVKIPLINLDFTKLDEEQIMIYHHSLLFTLSAQKKFQGNVWNAPRSQIRRICVEQQRRIDKISSELTNYLNSQF